MIITQNKLTKKSMRKSQMTTQTTKIRMASITHPIISKNRNAASFNYYNEIPEDNWEEFQQAEAIGNSIARCRNVANINKNKNRIDSETLNILAYNIVLARYIMYSGNYPTMKACKRIFSKIQDKGARVNNRVLVALHRDIILMKGDPLDYPESVGTGIELTADILRSRMDKIIKGNNKFKPYRDAIQDIGSESSRPEPWIAKPQKELLLDDLVRSNALVTTVTNKPSVVVATADVATADVATADAVNVQILAALTNIIGEQSTQPKRLDVVYDEFGL
jgi:hypothetical protein